MFLNETSMEESNESEQNLQNSTTIVVGDQTEKLQTPTHSIYSRKRKSNDSPEIEKNDTKLKKLKKDCIDLKQTLIDERASLQKLKSQKQEILRQLRLVKLYRTKNNLSQLQKLIDKWRDACQQSLIELQEKMPEPRPTIDDLIQLWQLDQDLLQYKKDEESF